MNQKREGIFWDRERRQIYLNCFFGHFFPPINIFTFVAADWAQSTNKLTNLHKSWTLFLGHIYRVPTDHVFMCTGGLRKKGKETRTRTKKKKVDGLEFLLVWQLLNGSQCRGTEGQRSLGIDHSTLSPLWSGRLKWIQSVMCSTNEPLQWRPAAEARDSTAK